MIMDEFAQTRGADDLFEDDFTPIHAPISQTVRLVPLQQQQQPPQRGGRNDRAIRGRGNQILRQPRQSLPQPQPSTSETVASGSHNGNLETSSADQKSPPLDETDPDFTPQPQQLKPPSAVRGDRTLTGGTLKPKLTEDELSARMAAAKLNNAKRAEAHRLAEADEANFQQREAQASQKRKEEGVARRVMNQEREKNRMRKLGAQGGREWDEGKAEQESERGSQYRRGAHGGVAYDTGSPRNGYQGQKFNEFHERIAGFVPRGGGRGRGDRGRGGKGRGGFAHNNVAQQSAPDPANDFPALPTAPRESPSALSTAQKNDQPTQSLPSDKVTQNMQPAVGGESWADQVDRVQEAKAP
ncbi:MAG: hypothetical protein ASARMPREDX12_000244 [Alectoria sarmentosa]|nr:MAG: hypothetical protein ASARMPREDX12_000244 [Alectoria sarmentosa]